jgi:hypothetical protein
LNRAESEKKSGERRKRKGAEKESGEATADESV